MKPSLKDVGEENLPFSEDPYSIQHLNRIFRPLNARERIHLLYAYFKEEEVLLTSSFGANSVFLLWLIHQMRPSQPVHFINTTFHFPETLEFKARLQERFDLSIIDVHPDPIQNKRSKEGEWWKQQPDRCCAVNKVAALEPIKAKHKVWFSGLMAFQTEFRSQLDVFTLEEDGLLKFHPLIDLPEGEFLFQMGLHQLPQHPLVEQGFGSIGCSHCTKPGIGRSGRWAGQEKTECGLHPGYFDKK